MQLPSKELLSAVLNNSHIHTSGNLVNNLIHYGCIYGNPPDDYFDTVEVINIYELAHKCKEWALSKGHTLNVQMSDDTTLVYIGSIGKDIEADTEPEAIFLACELILEQEPKDD